MIEIKAFKKEYRFKSIELAYLKSDSRGLYIKGINGAGKTTLLKAMADIIPFEGTILMPTPVLYLDASLPVPNWPLYRLKNLMTPPLQGLFESWFKEKEVYLWPKECSLGMLQKVRLCLGLSWPVKTILLDEPLRGLDEKAVRQLTQYLSEETKTVVMTSHESFNPPSTWQTLDPF